MNVSELRFHQTVGLEDDPAFRGYVIGWLDGGEAGPCAVVAVADPGGTKHRGNAVIAVEALCRAAARPSARREARPCG